MRAKLYRRLAESLAKVPQPLSGRLVGAGRLERRKADRAGKTYPSPIRMGEVPSLLCLQVVARYWSGNGVLIAMGSVMGALMRPKSSSVTQPSPLRSAAPL